MISETGQTKKKCCRIPLTGELRVVTFIENDACQGLGRGRRS
jgi:hypothetical protein